MQFEKMSTRIELQKMTQTVDSSSGEPIDQIVSSSNVWAEIKQPRGANSLSSVAGGEVGLGLQSFIIRYRDGVDVESYRVKDKQGYIWRIVDIPKIINRRQGLELVCQYTGKK
jgi:SPP1 family predicted phage head-tail adaptor